MNQEDVDQLRYPPLMVTLFKFQELGLSFDWSYQDEMIHSVPIPPDYLNDRIQMFYDEIRNLQPGFCDECGEWWMKRVQAYWGPRPLFCVPCWRSRLNNYIKTGDWPKAEIPE
jgi:hypothetical protein